MEILWFKNVGYISAFFDFARNDGLVGESLRLHLPGGSAFIGGDRRDPMIPHP
jgi:hypothetical protein